MSSEDKTEQQLEEAERASHDLPDQIARARARMDQYLDAMSRLEQRGSGQEARD